MEYQVVRKTEKKDIVVSIVIRCKNEAAKIDECIKKVMEQELEVPYEIIIIDSESTDDTLERVKKYDVSVYQIRQCDFNFGTSINLGVELSQGEFCVFLSAHAIPLDNKWLMSLLRPFSDENIVATYSRQMAYEDTCLIEKRTLAETFSQTARRQSFEAYFDKHGKMPQRFSEYRKEIAFSNSSSCIRKQTAVKYPFLKIEASEDREWALRVLREGYVIAYVPESRVYHAHNESLQQFYKRIYSNARAVDKFTDFKFRWVFCLPILFLNVLNDMRFCFKNKLSYSIKDLVNSWCYWRKYVEAHYKASTYKE